MQKKNNDNLTLVDLISQKYNLHFIAYREDAIESDRIALFWDLAANTPLLNSTPSDSGDYNFNFNCYINLRWFALRSFDPDFVLSCSLQFMSIHFDELMGQWLKKLSKKLQLEPNFDYLYSFNFVREGHLYLNLNEEQFSKLAQILENENEVVIFSPSREHLDLNEKWLSKTSEFQGSSKEWSFQRLDKHFMMHMFEVDMFGCFMLYRLRFKGYSRLKCANAIFLDKEICKRNFFELLPKATRCAKLIFEYKIRDNTDCFFIKYASWADFLNFYVGWDEPPSLDSFVAHTVSYEDDSIFLNLYFAHPQIDEKFLQRVSRAERGLFIDKSYMYDNKWTNQELSQNVICHGMTYIESHIALEPVKGELISYSFQQPSQLFSFECYSALYRTAENTLKSSYSSIFMYLYSNRLVEEYSKKDEEDFLVGPILI